MNFEGTLKKDKKSGMWIAEILALDVMTQGNSVEQALEMIKDGVCELLLDMFPKKAKEVKIKIEHTSGESFELRSSNSKLLISLALRRQREQEGLTIRDIAKKLGVASANSYAQYERGQINISLDMLDKLLAVVNPSSPRRLRIT
jgi:predicted RNase H-like HicB family nuclease